jgi:transcriptional regulator with XRE-family HTH domain
MPVDRFEADLAKRIGRNVRQHRTALGWSQAVLAERLDTSVEYISLLERGERLPALGTLGRLGKVLWVPPGQLLGDEAGAVTADDELVALARGVPEGARPAVLGMLRGVIRAYSKPRKR